MTENIGQLEHAAMDVTSVEDIADVRRVLGETLRADPADQRARMYLFQLLSIQGEWDRARSQLRLLAEQSPDAQMLAAVYGQAIEAMRDRAAALQGAGAIPMLAHDGDWTQELAGADFGDRLVRATASFDRAPDTPGEVDGRRFDLLFDGDSRFGPTIEAIVGARWGLIPVAAIEEITSEGPVDLRDLVWLPVEVRLRGGGAFAALLPSRYPDTEREADPALLLARRTEWRETPHGVQGVGQRVWTTDAGEDVPILSFRRIRFAG